MEINDIKRKPNPYYPITSKLNSKEFIGREDLISILRVILDDYSRTKKLKNVFISGDKAVGKSTILNRYKEILIENNFYIYEIELSRDANHVIDEYDFFKDFIDQAFYDEYPDNGGIYDSEQAEIWFSLTSGEFKHTGNYLDRKLAFASLYGNKMLGKRETLNYSRLEKDIKSIIKEILKPENQNHGVAFIIDEVQELTRNTLLLDLLRKLSENIPELIIIAGGLPTFLDNPLFEKFIRTSEPLLLSNFEKEESLDLIFRPLENSFCISRYDCESLFDGSTINTLLNRTNGNPLHLRILLAKLFEVFSKNHDKKKMTLDREVMENVMGYYCSESTNSRKIKNSLETASKEQLSTFAKLYKYEKLTIKAIIMIELAFESIQPEAEESIRLSITSDLCDIYDLGLFYLEGCDNNINAIREMTTNQLSQISYCFIGDSIDKLYAFYFYEDLTKNSIETNGNKSFEDHLAEKLSKELSTAIVKNKIQDKYTGSMLGTIINKSPEDNEDGQELISSIEKIKRIDPEKELSDEHQEMISKISFAYGLVVPAHILTSHEYEGYYLLMTNVVIRGKTKILYNYFPVIADIDQLHQYKEKINDYSTVIKASLHEYSIQINSMYLYWIPKQPLIMIHYYNINKSQSTLIKAVARRDFITALKLSETIFRLNIKIKDHRVATQVLYYNNYGFCLLCLEDYNKAKTVFEDISDKYLFSKINYAFLLYCRNEYEKAWHLLNNMNRKKLNKRETASYLHLMIKHPKIKMENIISEDIYLTEHIARNLALLSSQTARERSITNGFAKMMYSKKANPIDHRVKAWVNYYYNDIPNALSEIKNGISIADSKSRIYEDLKHDEEIFLSELTALP